MMDGEDKIIARAVRGEASAFGELYDHYQPQIYRFVVIRVGQREEAEDLTHQVFLRALQGIPRYEHRGFPFSSWLYRIARNQLTDYYRTKKNSLPLEAVDEAGIMGRSVEWNVEERLELERVTKAIQNLKPVEQEVLVLRFIEEMPLKEVAEIVEKSEGAVKLIQHRALKHLRSILTVS